MREPNHSFTGQNRASVCITSQLYDRRALDGPISTLPLISSLSHLAYLTSTSPRIREILTLDGGLERLVAIVAQCLKAAAKQQATADAPLKVHSTAQGGPFRSFASYSRKSQLQIAAQSSPSPTINRLTPRSNMAGSVAYARALLISYTLSLQSLVNVGVRGSESVRTRVVEAGVLSVAASVLRNYLEEREKMAAQTNQEERPTVKKLRSGRTAAANSAELLVARPASPAPLSIPAPIPISAPASPSRFASIPPALSAQSSLAPSRVGTPDNIASSSSRQQDSTSEDGEMPDMTEDMTAALAASSNLSVDVQIGAVPSQSSAMTIDEEEDSEGEAALMVDSARGRARSATVKSGPVPDHDDASLEESPATQTMDIDPVATESSEQQLAAETILLSPTPSIAQSLSRDLSQPTRLVVAAETSEATASTSHPEGFRYRDEDVLLCLQLLAYLSKYPHVRAVFHDPSSDYACGSFLTCVEPPPVPLDKSNNIFSLVEKYTIKPSDHRSALAQAAKTETQIKMMMEIQYWAGVIMRNACRKDEARGGIRQCANMLCGAWEKFPREFAKCRRCRKAKYCSKSCQSRAWQGGHRYWCSAREAEATSRQQAESSEPTEAEAATLARYLEAHPELATNETAVQELMRRIRHLHRGTETDRHNRSVRTRPHAIMMVDPENIQPTRFTIPSTFEEEEEIEDLPDVPENDTVTVVDASSDDTMLRARSELEEVLR